MVLQDANEGSAQDSLDVRAELERLSQDDITHMLKQHRRWLDSEGRKGNRAKFCRKDASGLILTGADLRNADLSSSNFSNASLLGADLRGAVLHAVDVNGANLNQTNLEGCNLNNLVGLLSNQVAGSNLRNASVPESLSMSATLNSIQEASINARKPFLAILLGCLYSWIIIASTKDEELIQSAVSSSLPILDVKIPIEGFYFVAPLLLVLLFAYLHVYMQRLWELISRLPSIFPDGRYLDQAIYPWVLTGVIRRYLPFVKTEKRRLEYLESLIASFLLWGVVPLTVIMFWIRYLPRHEMALTRIHVVLLVLSVSLGGVLYRIAVKTLSKQEGAGLQTVTNRDRLVLSSLGVLLALIACAWRITICG